MLFNFTEIDPMSSLLLVFGTYLLTNLVYWSAGTVYALFDLTNRPAIVR
jgi:hypothetical protein